MRSRRCCGKRTDEWKYLSLWGLSEHCFGDSTSSQKHIAASGVITMHTFEFVRPKDPAAAVASAARAKTAQQGADVRFIAGGTTLVDLMKLNVETPARLLATNR